MRYVIEGEEAVLKALAREAKKAGGFAAWSRANDFSLSLLPNVLHKRMSCPPRMAEAVGYRLEKVVYKRYVKVEGKRRAK